MDGAEMSDMDTLYAELATSREMCTKYEAAIGEDLAEILSLRAKLESARGALQTLLRYSAAVTADSDDDAADAFHAYNDARIQARAALSDD